MKLRGVRMDEACAAMLLRICYNRLRQSWVPGGYPPHRPVGRDGAAGVGALPGSKRSQERQRLLEVSARCKQQGLAAANVHQRQDCPARHQHAQARATAVQLPHAADWLADQPSRFPPFSFDLFCSLQALAPRGQQVELREQAEVAWLAQAFSVYREAVAAGVKPTMRMLNRVLMCLRVAWEGKHVSLAAGRAGPGGGEAGGTSRGQTCMEHEFSCAWEHQFMNPCLEGMPASASSQPAAPTPVLPRPGGRGARRPCDRRGAAAAPLARPAGLLLAHPGRPGRRGGGRGSAGEDRGGERVPCAGGVHTGGGHHQVGAGSSRRGPACQLEGAFLPAGGDLPAGSAPSCQERTRRHQRC